MTTPRHPTSREILAQSRFHHVRSGKIFGRTRTLPTQIAVAPARAIQSDDIEQSSRLRWEEHCVECAAPACYSTCDLFLDNGAGKCRRFLFGMQPATQLRGALEPRLEIVFLPWANLLANVREPLSSYEGFLLEVHNPGKSIIPVLFFFKDHDKNIRFLVERRVARGFHQFYFAFEDIGRFLPIEEIGSVFVAPNVQKPTTLSVGCEAIRMKPPPPERPAVKCIAFDLDGTLWDGTLVEQGAGALVVDQAILAAVQQLSAAGLILSIVSKNDQIGRAHV